MVRETRHQEVKGTDCTHWRKEGFWEIHQQPSDTYKEVIMKIGCWQLVDRRETTGIN